MISEHEGNFLAAKIDHSILALPEVSQFMGACAPLFFCFLTVAIGQKHMVI
jgi:hypothetical protein